MSSGDAPSPLDTTSEFIQVLTAPYHPPADAPGPHRAQPRPDHVARCRAAIRWTSSGPGEGSSSPPRRSASPHPALDQPMYRPHGRWAWTHGLPIDGPRQLLPLRKGAQCTASIDSGTVAHKEIKYICRKWNTRKQKEWYGFYSELGLYESEEYLRPLQGDVVPHIIGVHVMPEAVSMTMEMPHSSFWIESSPSMPEGLKERVIAAFEKIHARGVLHGDPELRHMLIGGDGKVMIIDFGMSRAVREDEPLGIERAEPEEFQLEMRKVKYKLDYRGARRREGDKVDDYLRRVRRNKKISELWKRRAKGERVGPIPEYEEDPEADAVEPPVNAQDFQEDWIPASEDSPMRVVVPGQTAEQVAHEVQGLLGKLGEMCAASGSCARRHWDGDGEDGPPRKRRRKGQAREARAGRRRHGGSPRDREEAELGREMEGCTRRGDHMRHKHVRNAWISSAGSGGRVPRWVEEEEPRTPRAEDYRWMEETRRRAMAQYARAPSGVLKRRRDGDGDGDEEGAVHRPSKRVCFSPQLAPATYWRSRAAVVCGRGPARRGRPDGRRGEFGLPSLRTLSALVGSLTGWANPR